MTQPNTGAKPEYLVAYFEHQNERDAFATVASRMSGVIDEVAVTDNDVEFIVFALLDTHLRTGSATRTAPMARVVAESAQGFDAHRVERHVDGICADRLV